MDLIRSIILNFGLNCTKEENEIFNLGKITLKNVKLLEANSDLKDWDKLNEFKEKFKYKIENYQGKFSDYFKNISREIELEERWSLGYDLSSE